MTGLEKIIKHIEDDAAAISKSILSEAEKKAEEIISAAKAEGEKKRAEITERSKLEVEASLSRAESAALLREKKVILNTKQEIIEDVITKAKESLEKLPENEYFDVIINMVKKNALNKPGFILFSKEDKVRLPEQFQEKIQEALTGKSGAALTISDETREIDGGFVLVYGDIEENCSFDALFLAARESLQDKVSKVLFD
ncbi:MAG: hypothetical protein K0R92_169 [Lachnospiraceae bacterium]|jgi:V/A-type H+-transporting ATPase subunit E|nr:hypothetical protein [Lachnospiraceae bacterium]